MAVKTITIRARRMWFYINFYVLGVKQRAKLTPLEGKTASKIDPPESDNLPAR